jgi:hypothetical protein
MINWHSERPFLGEFPRSDHFVMFYSANTELSTSPCKNLLFLLARFCLVFSTRLEALLGEQEGCLLAIGLTHA